MTCASTDPGRKLDLVAAEDVSGVEELVVVDLAGELPDRGRAAEADGPGLNAVDVEAARAEDVDPHVLRVRRVDVPVLMGIDQHGRRLRRADLGRRRRREDHPKETGLSRDELLVDEVVVRAGEGPDAHDRVGLQGLAGFLLVKTGEVGDLELEGTVGRVGIPEEGIAGMARQGSAEGRGGRGGLVRIGLVTAWETVKSLPAPGVFGMPATTSGMWSLFRSRKIAIVSDPPRFGKSLNKGCTSRTAGSTVPPLPLLSASPAITGNCGFVFWLSGCWIATLSMSSAGVYFIRTAEMSNPETLMSWASWGSRIGKVVLLVTIATPGADVSGMSAMAFPVKLTLSNRR